MGSYVNENIPIYQKSVSRNLAPTNGFQANSRTCSLRHPLFLPLEPPVPCPLSPQRCPGETAGCRKPGRHESPRANGEPRRRRGSRRGTGPRAAVFGREPVQRRKDALGHHLWSHGGQHAFPRVLGPRTPHAGTWCSVGTPGPHRFHRGGGRALEGTLAGSPRVPRRQAGVGTCVPVCSEQGCGFGKPARVMSPDLRFHLGK